MHTPTSRQPTGIRGDRGFKMSVKEHQKAWVKSTGRELPHGWDVHHINLNHNDNSPENLVALPRELHNELHSLRLYPIAWDELIGGLKSRIIGIESKLTGCLETTSERLRLLAAELADEQRNRKTKSVKGRVWRRGYKSKSTGEYTFIRTTIDELERPISDFKHLLSIVKKLESFLWSIEQQSTKDLMTSEALPTKSFHSPARVEKG